MMCRTNRRPPYTPPTFRPKLRIVNNDGDTAEWSEQETGAAGASSAAPSRPVDAADTDQGKALTVVWAVLMVALALAGAWYLGCELANAMWRLK